MKKINENGTWTDMKYNTISSNIGHVRQYSNQNMKKVMSQNNNNNNVVVRHALDDVEENLHEHKRNASSSSHVSTDSKHWINQPD